jgi:ribosomal protein L25 (general stress protein Ctc)
MNFIQPQRLKHKINNYIYTMKSITIKGSERESVGKVATKALRNAGVPCVLYGGDQPVHFSAQEKAFKTWFTLQTLTQL